jgi:hypothetical protein
VSETIRAEVLRSIAGIVDSPRGELDYPECLTPGCNKPASPQEGDGGLCRPCASDRRRQGRWQTRRIDE